MKKALVLCFSSDCEDYDLDTLNSVSDETLYGLAKDGVKNGNADICTLEDLCASINYGEDCFSDYYTFPIYVEESEYNEWSK